MKDNSIHTFLSGFTGDVLTNALLLRRVVVANLPGSIEKLDIPAKMITYCYGDKYSEMICTIVPSKKGLKPGFYKGTELPDLNKLPEGTGKISRYVVISSKEQIKSAELKKLPRSALAACRDRQANDLSLRRCPVSQNR